MTSSSKPRILVVDDELLNRRLIQAILAPEGYGIVHAASGEQALAVIAAEPVDLVLLDVMMPGVDGIEVCRTIRSERSGAILPVIMVSALTDPVSRTRAKEIGADDFLTKPVHEHELIARVRNLIALHAAYEANALLRRRAEVEARRWRVASELATAVAECLDYARLTTIIGERLAAELAIDDAMLLEVCDAELEVRGRSPARSTCHTMPWTGGADLSAGRIMIASSEDCPAYLRPVLDAGDAPWLAVSPIVIGASLRGLFCVARARPFDPDDRALLAQLAPHVGNAFLHVRSHLASVTTSRRLEDQLRHSQKMDAVGKLAGGVAHDFNNILAAILSNAELAREGLGDRHPLLLELREIEDSARRGAALTRQLLTFSRQERRAPKVIELDSVVASIEKMLARLVPEDIRMTTRKAASSTAVEADVSHLEQVVMNLVLNARDAMPHGGQLMIETSNVQIEEPDASQLGVQPGAFVVLAVSDTGCGIEPAVQPRIFEPFFTTKPVGKGTGLGLSTVFGIVQQSGGAIALFSEPGRGSTFHVYLPNVSHPASTVAKAPPPAAVSGAGTVLVVEDDCVLRAALRRQLAGWGYSILEAPNALAALDLLKLRPDPIDLLLTDLVMPGMDGRALARRVREDRPQVKVLFMSGYTEHAAVQTAAIDDAELFLEKPFTGSSLSTAIRGALQARS